MAAERGVNRTAHAGEAGPGSNVARVIRELRAQRVGHGYSAVQEGGEAYQLALAQGVHFEVCPYCSYLTGAVGRDQEHPLVRYVSQTKRNTTYHAETEAVNACLMAHHRSSEASKFVMT